MKGRSSDLLTNMIKNNQTRYLSKMWYDGIAQKHVVRNDFLATEEIHDAKQVAKTVRDYMVSLPQRTLTTPIVIFQH